MWFRKASSSTTQGPAFLANQSKNWAAAIDLSRCGVPPYLLTSWTCYFGYVIRFVSYRWNWVNQPLWLRQLDRGSHCRASWNRTDLNVVVQLSDSLCKKIGRWKQMLNWRRAWTGWVWTVKKMGRNGCLKSTKRDKAKRIQCRMMLQWRFLGVVDALCLKPYGSLLRLPVSISQQYSHTSYTRVSRLTAVKIPPRVWELTINQPWPVPMCGRDV